MKIAQSRWTKANGWSPDRLPHISQSPQLLLVFGATKALKEPALFDHLRTALPSAHFFGCSTAGEIQGVQVADDSVVVNAIHFEHTQVRGARVSLQETTSSFHAGEQLAKRLPPEVPSVSGGAVDKLAHVLVLSDGLGVNGSDLVRGLLQHLPQGVSVTGGLAGDGAHFSETLVFWNCDPTEGIIAVIGLYGSHLKVGFGSLGGWSPFGPERIITRSKGNVLYELDGQSALGLYKTYLGEHAKGLLATGLLFPLSLRTQPGGNVLVRTILAIDEKEQSMTFAGDMPEGAYSQLMKANVDRLIDGAVAAAQKSNEAMSETPAQLAILISCVGRKLVLRQRVEEELEGVREVLGEDTLLTGFYSYGEISPFSPGGRCELHNQTMTVTTIAET